jgi:hypothetical protein
MERYIFQMNHRKYDYVVTTIHSSFQLPLGKEAKQVRKALDSPYFNIFIQPNGRFLYKIKAIADARKALLIPT